MLDSQSYSKIWKNGILPLINLYLEKNDDLSLSDDEETVKNKIWEAYEYFNNKCRKYMNKNVKRLDRHKVCACYIFAILKCNPLRHNVQENEDTIFVPTEQLAISIGLTLLRSFLISKFDRNDEIKPKDIYEKDNAIFKNGFVFPCQDEVGHGQYRDNFAIELFFTMKEENYNILSLSHSLYLLEMYNRMNWEIMNSKRN